MLHREGPSKQWVRGPGAIAQQSTLSRAGQLAVPSRGTSAQGQVHGIQVGQARMQGNHIGGLKDAGPWVRRGEGRQRERNHGLPASCPPYGHPTRRSLGEGP